LRLQHNIRKQTIAIEVTSEELALALQPRMGDFNRQYLLPVMERVFDDLGEQAWQIRISRLDLDLGDVPFDRFEEVVPERFNSELRRALEEALRRQHNGPTADNYSQTLSASRLELFEYYLREGTLPFWASDSVFSFEQLVSELAEGQCAGLVRVIKQHAYQRSTLERIVLQLGEGMLRRLLQVLEPKYAALIITCLTDLRLIHRVEPVVELSENEFARSLWILVLTYVLQEPGSQFNRKALVESLLEGIARTEGVNYQQIVLALDLGLQQTMKSWPLESSLPAIVSEITHDLNLDAAREARVRTDQSLPSSQPEERSYEVTANEAAHNSPAAEAHRKEEPKPPDEPPQAQAASPLELLEYYLLYGTPFTDLAAEFNLEECWMGLAESDPAGLVRVIREHGRHGRVIESLAFQLGEQSLRRLANLLEPEYAPLILSYLTDLRAMHRVEPVAMVGGNEFARSLWILTLGYLSQERGSQFNRKSFIKSLFEEVAESEGLDYTEIVAIVQSGLRQAAGNRPLESSLPEVIGELISELEESGYRGPSDTQDTVEDAQRAYSVDSISTQGSVSLRLSDAVTQLESYLDVGHDAAGDLRKRRSDASALLRLVASQDAAKARQLIWQFARRYKSGLPTLVDCLLSLFRPVDLLAALAPEQKQFLLGFAGVVRSVGAQVAPAGRGQRVGIDDLFWKATLEYLLSDVSGHWNRRAMVREIVKVVAEGVVASPVSLADTLAEALQQTVGTAESSLVRAVDTIRQDLSDLSRSPIHTPPAFARYDHVDAIRYYLRYGVLPWSALLRNPKMTAASVLSFLPGLPRSLLYAVFTGESPGKQLQTILRGVRMMSDDSIVQLLRALLTEAKDPDSPFRSALSSFASRVKDKQAFYARLLAAILNGHPLDLEELAASAVTQRITIETVFAGDPVQWNVDVLKSALVNQVRFGRTAGGEHSPFTLFHTLASRHPKDARHFCRALRDTPDLLAAITPQYSTPDFDRLLDLLRPGDVPNLKAMTRAIAGLPSSCSAERVHEVILGEVLRLEESQALQDSFFDRVLMKLFEPLAGEARELLSGEAASKWADSENLPLAGGEASAASTDESSRRLTIRKPAVSREDVFALLLEESRKPMLQSESREEAVSPELELLSADALSHTLTLMLEESPEDVYSFVTRQAQDSRVREHWAKTLPESTLARLSYLLKPQRHRSLLDTAELLASAWLEAIPSGCRAPADRQAFWGFVLGYLDRTANADLSVEGLVAAFFQDAATRYRASSSPEAPDDMSVGTRMLECASRLARAAGHVGLHAVLRGKRKLLLASWEPLSPTQRSPMDNLEDADRRRSDDPLTVPRREPCRMAFSMEVEEEKKDTGQPVYINNAGLVLTSPFLPHLFETLNLLRIDEEGRTTLRDRGAVSRAVHLLQYMVDGSTSAPEPLLALNKILCGVPISTAVDREIEPTEEERANCERMLRAMIANWTTISNTSISGLQETFFRREGKLERRDEEWKLRIQRKTVDVLVDQIPWTVSVIYNSWMPQPLYVDW